MAKGTRGGVSITLDERSLRSFKKNCNALARAVGENARYKLTEFCQEVLKTSNDMIPVDTGTAASSAGFKIERKGYDVYEARVGYGVKRDPVNPRTGKRASEYVGTIHESYHYTPSADAPVSNGQGKFFEKALNMHAGDFESSLKESLRDILAHPTSVNDMPVETEEDIADMGSYLARKNQGFTARHGGQILPYPVYSDKELPTRKKRTNKKAISVRSKGRENFSKQTAAHKKRSKSSSKATRVRHTGSRKYEQGVKHKYKSKVSKKRVTANKHFTRQAQHIHSYDLLNETVNELWNINEEAKKEKKKKKKKKN